MISLSGGWQLVDYILVGPDGNRAPIWPSVAGSLLFTDDGAIAAVIVKQPAEGISANEIIAYSGAYILSGQDLNIAIHVSNVRWHHIAPQTRKVSVEDGILTMVLENHPRGTHIVRWRRLQAK